jgi:flagellar hook-basal body complex protein FliE
MVERIGNEGSLVREAILAALKSQSQHADALRRAASDGLQGLAGASAESGAAASAQETSFGDRLAQGLRAIDQEVRGVDDLPGALVSGKIQDFHEVAVQIKQAEFTFRFAMEVRNKLIDAYREVMRMSV